jgi:hypothetical protein
MEDHQKKQLMQELALVLIYLSSWKEKDVTGEIILHAWKGYDFDILDRLKEDDLVDFSYKAKSLYIPEKGRTMAEMLLEKFETKF